MNNMKTQTFTTKYGKKVVMEEGSWFGKQRIENKGPYQQRNLKFLKDMCPHSRVTLDIGAHVGMNTIEYADFSDHVYAWEPFKETYEMALMTIDANNVKNATIYNAGLGSENTNIKTIQREGYSAQNQIRPEDSKSKKDGPVVDIRTLDSYNFTNVDIIKIDVEGYEMEVLQGAIETIKNNNPIVQVEIDGKHLKRFKYTPQDIYDWFLERNFAPYRYDGTQLSETYKKEKGVMDTFFIRE